MAWAGGATLGRALTRRRIGGAGQAESEDLEEIGGSVGGNKHLDPKFIEHEDKAVCQAVKKMIRRNGQGLQEPQHVAARLRWRCSGARAVRLRNREAGKGRGRVQPGELRTLNQAARQIGVDPGELKNLIEQFEAVGVKSETAVASIGAICELEITPDCSASAASCASI